MDDITVTTPRGGVVRLRSAPEHLIERVRELLPLGLEVLPSNPGTTAFGIVMQRGSKEAVALRQKTIEFSPEHAAILSKTHTMLVAIALAKFAKAALPGLLMPCPYFRINERNRIETGIAFFGGMPDFNSSNEDLRQRTVFDDVMGHGFTDLWCQFTPILMACSQEYKLSLQRFIDLDLRYRSRLGSIEFGFLVVDGQIVALKTSVGPQDPVWAAINTFCGIDEVWHLPSIPFADPEVE